MKRALYSTSHREGAHQHDLRHIRHCVDYLRQTLMCAADATLEPVESNLGGVTGWGVQRKCRSYADLSNWAEDRRASNEVGFGDD